MFDRRSHVISALCLFMLAMFIAAIGAPWHATPVPQKHLSETGLYSDFANKIISPENLQFAPQYPLWSDGAKKKRWIYLPPNKPIDAAHVDDWVFPVGTKVWKEFSFSKRVETRHLEKVGKNLWTYASYVWNDDETDAVLVSEKGLPNHHEIAPGIRHDIPGVIDCKACHEGQGRDVVLGFNLLQLSSDRDPNVPNGEPLTPDMITLRTLMEQNRIARMPEYFLKNAPRIGASTPRARAALGYLYANCGGCHNSTDPLSSVGMFLKGRFKNDNNSAQWDFQTVIGQKSKYQIPDLPTDSSFRIMPGDPLKSAVAFRMNSRNPYRQMPPLGTKIVDQKAVALITSWIKEDLKGYSNEVETITTHQ